MAAGRIDVQFGGNLGSAKGGEETAGIFGGIHERIVIGSHQECAGRGGGNGQACQSTNEQLVIPAKVAPASTGALILGVLCGTAAQEKGIAAGDVITSVNGQPVTTPDSLRGITARYHPGTVVSVNWVGVNGVKHTSAMTLGSGPAR